MQKVAWFGARVMDRMLPREGIDQVNIWAMGRILLADGSGERVWKGVRLVLDKKGRLDAGMNSLSHLATVDPQRYLSLCPLQSVDASEFPEWPKWYSPV